MPRNRTIRLLCECFPDRCRQILVTHQEALTPARVLPELGSVRARHIDEWIGLYGSRIEAYRYPAELSSELKEHLDKHGNALPMRQFADIVIKLISSSDSSTKT
jgi:hypothetical protein